MVDKKFEKIFVNKGTEEEFSVKGYKKNILHIIIFYILGIISVGFLFLLGYWYPVRRLKFTHKRCCLKDATVLQIREKVSKEYFISKVDKLQTSTTESALNDNDELTQFEKTLLSCDTVKYFKFKFLRYFFKSDFTEIIELSGLDNVLSVKSIYELAHGIRMQSAKQKTLLHGDNYINVPVKSYFLIFIQLVADPFYVFQVFSISLWYADTYYYYASAIVFLTVLSLSINTYETKSHLQNLSNMVGRVVDITVLQTSNNGEELIIKSSRDLVPGDVLVIPPEGMKLPCDAVLLNGRCVVNESTLTGESFPTTKTALDSITSSSDVMHEMYSVDKHKRHTLYNGTEILQAHFYGGGTRILAVVLRTGFSTLKGRLIRSILHPKPIHFTFFRDSMKFILFIGFLAFIGFLYSIIVLIQLGEPPSTIAIKALDVFAIAVPPELPACMSIGLMHALYRMKRQQIYCVDPARVNLCGKIKLFVFDKTGTLTEDSLDVSGVIRVEEQTLLPFEDDEENLRFSPMIKGMACCHSLTIINDEIAGDPLDLYMFNFTKWQFKEPSDIQGSKFNLLTPVTVFSRYLKTTEVTVDGSFAGEDNEVAILKQFPFESSLQRMSVITKELNAKHMIAYVKGSPEMILSMCKKESIPKDIHKILLDYTKTGSRVLGMGLKDLADTKWHKIDKLQRSEIECNLMFIGLIIFNNVVKRASKATIEELQSASIRTVMATGDNLYTAVSVAREVNIVKSRQKTIMLSIKNAKEIQFELLQLEHAERKLKHLLYDTNIMIEPFSSLDYCIALSGSTYMKVREHYPDLLPNVLLAGSVFARMSPDQKSTLVEDLKSIGYGVGMCGDGANDCGALKAAHAGIALSDSEASVSSPFTSKIFDISCVPRLLKEGRAALITSFSIFKYMAIYSFIQFIGILILYTIGSAYSNWQFMYADLFVNLLLVVTMIQSKASTRLTSKRPPGRLVHPIFLGGIILQVFTLFVFQFGSYLCVQQMHWYKKPNEFSENVNKELYYTCYENYAVVIVSFFQYSWLSIVCSSGKPYRVPIYKNYKYMFFFVLTTMCTMILTIYPPEIFRKFLSFAKIPSYLFKVLVLLIALAHLYTSYIIEKLLLPSKVTKSLSDFLQRKSEPKNQYKHIYQRIKSNANWPPINDSKLRLETRL